MPWLTDCRAPVLAAPDMQLQHQCNLETIRTGVMQQLLCIRLQAYALHVLVL